MARHKQCQKLGGSRYADLTKPQGVTQFIERKQIPTVATRLQRGGGWEKTEQICYKVYSLVRDHDNDDLNYRVAAFIARQCL